MRRRHVLTCMNVIEDASLGACDARVLSVNAPRCIAAHFLLHRRCCHRLNHTLQQFYSQEEQPSASNVSSVVSNAPHVVDQTQFDELQPRHEDQSHYMSMTQASSQRASSQREMELRSIEQQLSAKMQPYQLCDYEDEEGSMTDDDAPIIPSSSPCSPDLGCAPCPSPPPKKCRSAGSSSKPAPQSAAEHPPSSARLKAKLRGVAKSNETTASSSTSHVHSRKIAAAAKVKAPAVAESALPLMKPAAAKLADASRGSSRRRCVHSFIVVISC